MELNLISRECESPTVVVVGGSVGAVLVARGLTRSKKFNVVLVHHLVRLSIKIVNILGLRLARPIVK